MAGKFIIAEGMDFAGKTLALSKLKELYGSDDNVVFTREPGGLNNTVAEDIRELIFKNSMDPVTEAYLFASSRAEHTKKIKDLLDQELKKLYRLQ